MAVVYFTSNASTGAGSLVEAIKNASPGDVIRPDETVFERGSTIEIVLAATLTLDKNLTLDGGPFRVRLNADGRTRCVALAENANVEMTAFDVVGGGWNSQTNADVGNAAGAGLHVPGGASIALNRCGFFACRGTYGGAIAVGTGAAATLNNCVVAGCYARGSGAGIRSVGNASVYGSTIMGNVEISPGTSADILADGSGTGRVTLVNSIVGKCRGNVEIGGGCVVGVASSQIGFVAAPPDDLSAETWNANAWENWNLRLLDDASPNPSPYRDAGDVDAASKYDFDGNFRGRETDGAATRSPGAFETIQADLFWVGRDATGATVATPTFNASDGWATSRFAAVSGDVAPQTGQAFFIGRDVAFADAPPDGSTANVGGGVKVSTGSGAGVSTLNLGVGSVFDVATSVSAGRFGAESLVKLRAGTLTVDGETTTDATEPLRFVRWTGGRLRVVGYLHILEALAIPSGGTLELDGATLRVATSTVGDGATVEFAATLENDSNAAPDSTYVDAILTATESATVGAATFAGVGYFATPPGTDLTAATFAETIRRVDVGAEVKTFAATATGPTTARLEWSATDATARVCVERENAAAPNGWEVVATTPTEDASPLEVALSGKERFRIFDGATFSVDSAWFPTGDFYVYVADDISAVATVAVEWETTTQLISAGNVMYRNENVLLLASIKNKLTAVYLSRDEVESATATVYAVSPGFGAREIWTPVDGWENIAVPLDAILEEPTGIDGWTLDAVGPNFVWTPDTTERLLFGDSGTFAVQVCVKRKSGGNPIYFTFRAVVK